MPLHPPGHPESQEGTPPFLPLSFRFFASLGLLVLHLALPPEVRASGPGEGLYLSVLLLLLLEATWEAGRGLKAEGNLFPTPSLPWIRWNLALDLALVTLVIAYQGVLHERFSTLYIFPVLASAFYLGTVEIVWIGVLSSFVHIALVEGFATGVLPPFGESSAALHLDGGQIAFILGLAALQIFATTLVVVVIRGNIERLRSNLSASEAAADELAELHGRVVESMSSGLITLDLADCVTSANPAAEEILRSPVPVGRRLHEILPLAQPASLLLPGREHRFELTLRDRTGGTRILGGHLASLRSPEGKTTGRLLLFQDLTELKALEERTRISERLATVGQLAAGLAHELRNPLASISGCVQILQNASSRPAIQDRVLGILDRESQRVNAIVSDFLDLARPGAGERQRLLLPQVVEEARASWEMDPRTAGLSLRVEPAPDVAFEGEPHAIHRIFMNLLSNARKAVAGCPEPAVWIRFRILDGRIGVVVADNGCGMDQAQLDRIFEPFAGSFQEGSGLGMSLVFKWAEEMGWGLDVRSQPGGGTEVELVVPLFDQGPGMAKADSLP